MKNILKNKWFNFGIAAAIYLLWVLWIGSFWLLLGLGVIFDIYITKKVNWSFWKKRGTEKKSALIEWVDALVFAVIAATLIRMFFIEAFTIPTSSMEKSLLVGDYLFVSKVSYGPKMPNTPISFPFAHHTLPLTKYTKSYLTWIQWPYKRLAGLGEIKRDDVVVFNFPEGDTVALQVQEQSYYALSRMYTKQQIWDNYDISVRPVDKRENYIKRCVALPGDKLEVVDGNVYINDMPQKPIPQMQYKYRVVNDGNPLRTKSLEKLGISKEDIENGMIIGEANEYVLPLIEANVGKIKEFKVVKEVVRNLAQKGQAANYIFPHNANYLWNEDNFGPLTIPKKGQSVSLSMTNIPIYQRIIDVYENNDLQIKDSTIFINGKQTNEYTFKMDYYFMMGDSRHNSADSRFWGFVPEDHVVGKAVFIWLSLDKDKSLFEGKIRWNRMFRTIH